MNVATSMPSNLVNPPATSAPASLYVGDLEESVTEDMLFEKFTTIGRVVSIRVCRDAITRRSLGYAYVNFEHVDDASKALDRLNHNVLKGKSMRIMWLQRDPAIRRSGAGNIIVKNLNKHIDARMLQNTFSKFGQILSCKVASDEKGNSKGFGFIQFQKREDADNAIERVNGMEIEGLKVEVCSFLSRSVRLEKFKEMASNFTNCYVKNFADHVDSEKLKNLFEKFGSIKSAVVMTESATKGDETREKKLTIEMEAANESVDSKEDYGQIGNEEKSRGFGFVDFENHDDAVRACQEMDSYELPGVGLRFTVCRAMKKAERQAYLRERFEKMKLELQKRTRGRNLYVKNLEPEMDDKALYEIFCKFGPIESAKVMVDVKGQSKLFGFVCYEKGEDADKAIDHLNGTATILGKKPLYVAQALNKMQRHTQLNRLASSQYNRRRHTWQYVQPGSGSGHLGKPVWANQALPTNASFIHSQPGLQYQTQQAAFAASQPPHASTNLHLHHQPLGHSGRQYRSTQPVNYQVSKNPTLLNGRIMGGQMGANAGSLFGASGMGPYVMMTGAVDVQPEYPRHPGAGGF